VKKLAEPDADLVERVLDEVGFEGFWSVMVCANVAGHHYAAPQSRRSHLLAE